MFILRLLTSLFILSISLLFIQPVSSANAASCSSITAIFAPGSGQGGGTSSREFNKFEDTIKKYSKAANITSTIYRLGSKYQFYMDYNTWYQYPAVAVGTNDWEKLSSSIGAGLSFGEGGQYGWSVGEGVHELAAYINNTLLFCPNTKFIIAGYSQGANVIDNYIKSDHITDKAKNAITYYGALGDPRLYLPEGEDIGFLLSDIPACRNDNQLLSAYREYVPNCKTHLGSLRKKPGKMKTDIDRSDYIPNNFVVKTGTWCEWNDFVCGSTNLPWEQTGHSKYATNGHVKDLVEKALTLTASHLQEPDRSALLYSIRTGGYLPPTIDWNHVPSYPKIPTTVVEKNKPYIPPARDCLYMNVIDISSLFIKTEIEPLLKSELTNYKIHTDSIYNSCMYSMYALNHNELMHIVSPTRSPNSIKSQIDKFVKEFTASNHTLRSNGNRDYTHAVALNDPAYTLLSSLEWEGFKDTDYNIINFKHPYQFTHTKWVTTAKQKHTVADVLKLSVKKKIKVKPFTGNGCSKWGLPVDEEVLRESSSLPVLRSIFCQSLFDIYGVKKYIEPAELSPIPTPNVKPILPTLPGVSAIKTANQRYEAKPGQKIIVRIEPKNPTVFMEEYTYYAWDWDSDGTIDNYTDYGTASHIYESPFTGKLTVSTHNINNKNEEVKASTEVIIENPKPITKLPIAQEPTYSPLDSTTTQLHWNNPKVLPDKWLIAVNGISIGLIESKKNTVTISDINDFDNLTIAIHSIDNTNGIGEAAVAVLEKHNTEVEKNHPDKQVNNNEITTKKIQKTTTKRIYNAHNTPNHSIISSPLTASIQPSLLPSKGYNKIIKKPITTNLAKKTSSNTTAIEKNKNQLFTIDQLLIPLFSLLIVILFLRKKHRKK